jgi:hypothetical protein
MRSHSYVFSARECIKAVGPLLLGVATLAGGLHGAHWLGILPPARLSDSPDETLLAFKVQLSESRHPAEVILLGDSSCATGIDAPKLRTLLPGNPDVLNLGLFIGFGLDIYGEILSDYLKRNSDEIRLVVLLVTPQFLTDENVLPSAYPFWRRMHLRGEDPEATGRSGLSAVLGVGFVKDRLFRQILHTPIRGFYGFSSNFAEYLARHEGSMVEPGTFHPPQHPVPNRYYLAPTMEKASRDFRQRLPPGVKLAIGITPLPESLCSSDYLRRRTELLGAWNRWIGAEYVLTNAPAKMADTFFATGAHLNPAGQERYTRQLGAVLARACLSLPLDR